MKPRGLLMMEHRVIEEMIELIRKDITRISETNRLDPVFLDTAVDFIRTYADRTHHGKEEDILFRDLQRKDLLDEDARIMNELIEEHIYGREATGELVRAKEDYMNGNHEALEVALEKLNALVEFYPQHILKEDDVFFPNSEKYFSDDEIQAMLEEFRDFDKNMIHEKYKQVVEKLKETRL